MAGTNCACARTNRPDALAGIRHPFEHRNGPIPDARRTTLKRGQPPRARPHAARAADQARRASSSTAPPREAL